MAKNEEASLLLRIKTAGEEALGRLTITIGDLIGIAKNLANALVAPVMEFKNAERASNMLTQAMINAGVYTSDLKNKYLEIADALAKKSTYQDDDIVKAQTAAQQYLKNTQITQRLTQSILDYAAATGTDLVSAAEKVGKSIGTKTNAMARDGIVLSDNMSKSERMAATLQQLEMRYKGSAEAATEGLGVLDQLKNAFGEMSEELGKNLAPIIQVVSKAMLGMARDGDTTKMAFEGIVAAVRTLMGVGVGVVEVFEIVGKSIGSIMGTTVGALVQLFEGNFKQAWTTIKTGFSSTMEEVSATAKKYDQIVADINKTGEEKKTADTTAEVAKRAAAKTNAIANEQIENDANRAREFQAAQDHFALQMAVDQANQDMSLAQFETNNQSRLMAQNAAEQASLQAQISFLTKQAQSAATAQQKEEARKAAEDAMEKLRQKRIEAFQIEQDQKLQQQRKDTLDNLSAMQNSKNKEMAAVGKAAALVQIGLSTHEGAIKAYSSLAGIPYVGPALGAAAAGALIAYGAERAAAVSGIALAEGGIVRARPGGIQATIGEGGQDEAVIPLDRAGEFMSGKNNITINVNGGMLGDEQQARTFAQAVDRELLKLRQNNESVSFDSGVV